MIAEAQKQKKEFIPRTGYNVVAVDDFELPGSQLYLIAHYADEAKAKATASRFQKVNPDEKVYVYGPDTK